jgi:hypothetical protein
LIGDPRVLATSMFNVYRLDTVREARRYAFMLKDAGKQGYAIWIEAADIIARWQNMKRTLDV